MEIRLVKNNNSVNIMDAKLKVDALDLVLTGELATDKGKPTSDEGIINRIFSDQALGFPIMSMLVEHLNRLGTFITYCISILECLHF